MAAISSSWAESMLVGTGDRRRRSEGSRDSLKARSLARIFCATGLTMRCEIFGAGGSAAETGARSRCPSTHVTLDVAPLPNDETVAVSRPVSCDSSRIDCMSSMPLG